jgi:hypothetical protein
VASGRDPGAGSGTGRGVLNQGKKERMQLASSQRRALESSLFVSSIIVTSLNCKKSEERGEKRESGEQVSLTRNSLVCPAAEQDKTECSGMEEE